MINDTESCIKEYDLDIASHSDMSNISDSIKNLLESRNVREDTLDFESEEFDIEETISFDQKEKAERLKSLKNMVSNKRIIIDSYYESVEEFYGEVDAIDKKTNTFNVSLRPGIEDKDEKIIKATFDIDDVQESDKKLLSIGTQLVWIIGKERKENNVRGVLKPGNITNFSRLYIRRTRVLSKKKRTEIEEQANRWSQFFKGLD